jgi:hypothetical protein
MLTSPRDFFVQNVRVAYDDFMDARRHPTFGEHDLLRLGIAAAVTLYHFREHLTPQPIVPSSDYAILRDVANISKHKRLIIARYEDGQGPYHHSWVDVGVDLRNGAKRLLADALFNVMGLWRRWLRDEGIIPGLADPASIQLPRFVERASATSVPFKNVAGEGRHWEWAFLEYDAASDELRPRDLAGCQITFRAWQAPRSVDMTFTFPAHNVAVDVAVPLTEEQGVRFMRLTEAEREAYVVSIVLESAELKRMAEDAVREAIVARSAEK